MWQIARFLTVGALNTAVGACVIFGLMLAGVGAVPANLAGYAVGLCTSFVLNRRWTFNSDRPVARAIGPFLLVFGVAYLASLAVLVAGIEHVGLNPYLAQAAAIGVYTALSFVGFRRFAFGGPDR